jgi:hypothetical protein
MKLSGTSDELVHAFNAWLVWRTVSRVVSSG